MSAALFHIRGEGKIKLSVLKTYGEGTEFAPSKTYRLIGDRIIGAIDGKEAVLQAIELMLSTQRWRYRIFSGDYGCELQALLGESGRLLETEIELLVREALEEDDRIASIENISVKYERDTAEISFTAVSRFGEIDVERSIWIG